MAGSIEPLFSRVASHITAGAYTPGRRTGDIRALPSDV